MKRKILFEVIWLAGCLIAARLLYNFVSSGTAQDIAAHDTYIVGGVFGEHPWARSFIFGYFLTFGFFVYLMRVLYTGFKVIIPNIMLLAFAGLCLYFLSDIIFMIHYPVMHYEPAGTTPSSPPVVTGLFYGSDYDYPLFWAARIIKILLMLVLAFTGFKTGRSWNRGD